MSPLVPELSRVVNRSCGWFFWSVAETRRRQIRELTIRNLESLRRIFARHGIRFALSSIAHPRSELLTREQADYFEYAHLANGYYAAECDVLNEELRAYCSEKKLLYIPFDENMRDYRYMQDWCHMNQNGKRYKADMFALFLRDYLAGALETSGASPGS